MPASDQGSLSGTRLNFLFPIDLFPWNKETEFFRVFLFQALGFLCLVYLLQHRSRVKFEL